VLEITNLIAGPTGGRILAELGADVIKLEPPGGDMSRPIGRTYFYAVNFDKRSVAVDTSKPEGKAVVRRIAKTVDALLANVRPQATARMGLDTTLNPRLIETHLTGYGWTGPYSKRPGIDPLAQAYMGLSRAQGGPENPPVFAAQLAPTDFTTGAMGALGTILALYHRQRTGVVQRVDSNLLSGGIVLSSAWFTRYAGRPERPLADKEQMGLGPCHRLVNVSDGWIYLAADTEAQQQALARLTSGGKSLPALTRQAALSSLAAAGIPAAEVTSPDSDWFLAHAQARANGMVAERQHPTAGRFWVSWQTIAFPGGTPTAGLPTPLLGEHTEAVLRESGYTDAEIAALYEARTVLTERPKRSA
jgi:crotonobetainyl-CoA:carnitine CoA-transferase CaiB-like acyl-CoA transferase